MNDKTKARMSAERLRWFEPFAHLDTPALRDLSGQLQVRSVVRGQRLFELGDDDANDFLLLQGEVKLTARDGRSLLINDQHDLARRPLARLRPRQFAAQMSGDGQVLVIHRDVVTTLIDPQTSNDDYFVNDSAGKLTPASAMETFQADLNARRFVLPSLPDVALKVRRVSSDADSSVADLARIIKADPAISLKLVKVANSAFYRGTREIASVDQALVRLGMQATRQLVIAFTLRELYQADSDRLKQFLNDSWQRTVSVGAIAHVLAKHLKKFDPEAAMLAGMLSCLGESVAATFLRTHWDHWSDQVGDCRLLIAGLAAPMASTLLEYWNFPPELIEVARESRNWKRTHEGPADLCDLVQIAYLHHLIGEKNVRGMPRLVEVPAYGAFNGAALTPETTVAILREAQTELQAIRRELSA